MQYLKKNKGNDQKPRFSMCIVIEPHNFKFCVLSYMVITLHNLNIAISAIAFSLHNFKILPMSQFDFFFFGGAGGGGGGGGGGLVIPINFAWR